MDEWKDDIEKYLSGKLTPAERHALEKKALSDFFLADALEGAETISSSEFASDLSELNQKISGTKQSRWIWPLRIAASVIGIALVSSIVFYSVKDDETQIASTPKPTETTASEEAKSTDTLLAAETKSSGGETLASRKAKEKVKAEELLALQSLKESRIEMETGGSGASATKAKSTSSTVGPSELRTDSTTLSGLAGVSLTTAQIKTDSVAGFFDVVVSEDVTSAPIQQQPVAADEGSKISRARKTQPINLMVSGQVRDQQGQPIPGVNIVIKGSNTGTVTNAEGKYSIALSEQNQSLVYSFIGFVAQEQPADKAKTGGLDVQLQEDATQLSEVVVTGYAERKTDGEPVVRLAEPMGGRKAYDKYLEDKKVYPLQALENKVEGKVIIEFTITTTGAITDFNVVRKIGYGCEDEVIRLVKEGPKWYPSYIDNEAVESLVRVKTRFELKK